MSNTLQTIYASTDLAGRVYNMNDVLKQKLDHWTTQVSSVGQQSARPASLKRRWATRAVAAVVVSSLPVLPLTALTVGPLALLAFGVGRKPNQAPRSNALMQGYDYVKSHGVLGLPEYQFLRRGTAAGERGEARAHNIYMGAAIALGLLAQPTRVVVALIGTCGYLADGTAQIVAALGAAAFGMLSEHYHAPRMQAA